MCGLENGRQEKIRGGELITPMRAHTSKLCARAPEKQNEGSDAIPIVRYSIRRRSKREAAAAANKSVVVSIYVIVV